ncbi:hypothetical protein BKA70DRAFT_1516572 [Coprinopsis sp. MPI-PUGE-AT-0042]|nr:hypothetical protein BKA70DRAFT_1516572 [Coprinopsis sp. MPI-PUGE-AT-0042]
MATRLPTTTKSLVVRIDQSVTPNGSFIHPAVVQEQDLPELTPGKVLVKINAVAFNHKDLWIRKGTYPWLIDGAVVGSDAAGDQFCSQCSTSWNRHLSGVVIASSDAQDSLLNRRVFLVPSRGWKDDPDAPEEEHSVLGGAAMYPSGTFSEYIVVERDYVIPIPDHLDDVHAAAWPLGGLTAWRATVVNAAVKPGHNVLITGIGGGVALLALQFCVALGASVYVTSGNPEKVRKAVELGAKGGVTYQEDDWAAKVHGLLQKDQPSATFHSIIDSAGNEIMEAMWKYLRPGGRLVIYGVTAGPTVTMTMNQIVMGQRIIASMLGSQKELRDATKFCEEHKIVPPVSHVLEGLENAPKGYDLLNTREQFGKVIVKI